MKTAIIYYSLEGNTKLVCDKIASQIDADLIRIEPVKEYPKKGLAKFFHGGKAATFGEKPELKPYTFEASNYEKVILACPVWAGKCAAPVNTFLEKHGSDLMKMGGDKIGVVLCQSGKGAENVIASYKKQLNTDTFAASLILIDPLKKTENAALNQAAIDEFCKAFV